MEEEETKSAIVGNVKGCSNKMGDWNVSQPAFKITDPGRVNIFSSISRKKKEEKEKQD